MALNWCRRVRSAGPSDSLRPKPFRGLATQALDSIGGFMRNFVVAALLFFCFFPSSYANARADDNAQIRSLIEDFRTAIIEKDRDKFLGLFLHQAVTWQAVMSDARFEQAKQKDPAAQKAAFDPTKTPTTFIDGIAKDPKVNEETFSDVMIDSDGDVASVAFNFSYIRDKQITNVGREYWLLVRTEAGWKIAAVTYSRNVPTK